jgi:preprotein translocase subunit YajC
MAVGIARNTDGSEGAKTRQQAYAELEARVQTQEQFDTEAARKGEEQARKQAGFEALSQTQLPDEFVQGYAGPKQAPDIDIDAQKLEINKQADIKYNDVRSEFLNGTLKGANNKPITSASEANKIAVKERSAPAKGEASTLEPTATLQVTPSGEALLNQEQIDAQDFRRLAEKQHQELIDAGVKSEATKEMGKLFEKTRVGSQVDLFGGKKGTLKEEVIPARVQDFGTAPVQEDIVTKVAEQAKATAEMSKVVAKTKEGEQVDLFGGKKGTIKEVAIPEAKVAETVAPKQSDIVDEAKQILMESRSVNNNIPTKPLISNYYNTPSRVNSSATPIIRKPSNDENNMTDSKKNAITELLNKISEIQNKSNQS